MTKIENDGAKVLTDRELDVVSGGDSLLKYAILDGVRQGMAETYNWYSARFSEALK